MPDETTNNASQPAPPDRTLVSDWRRDAADLRDRELNDPPSSKYPNNLNN